MLESPLLLLLFDNWGYVLPNKNPAFRRPFLDWILFPLRFVPSHRGPLSSASFLDFLSVDLGLFGLRFSSCVGFIVASKGLSFDVSLGIHSSVSLILETASSFGIHQFYDHIS